MQAQPSLAHAIRTASVLGLFSVIAGLGTTTASAEDAQSPAEKHRPSARSTMEEVVVTARRRDESAQDVPIALSVVNSEALEATGTFTLAEVQRLAPSLQVFSFNPRNTNINIRGLGSNVAVTNDGLESGVGVYIDNVYYGRPGQSQFDLIDLEQVEVLRGPQGTLFGKNTTAGAINITTSKPSFDSEIKAEGSYASEGYRQLRASLTGPLIDDVLAYRLTLGHTERDGLVKNVHTGEDINDYTNETVRGQLLFTPSEQVEVRLIGDYSKQESNGVGNSIVGVYTHFDNGAPISNSFTDRVNRQGYTAPSDNPYDRKVDLDSPVQADMESYGFSAQVDWQLETSHLTSVTSYRGWNWYPANDIDATSLEILPVAIQANTQRQFSQEIRLASQDNQLVDYVAGVYYLWQRNTGEGSQVFGQDAPDWYLPQLPVELARTALGGYGGVSFSEPEAQSYAAFGQLVWHLTEQWELTTGLRYTYEDKTGEFHQSPIFGASLDELTPVQQATANAIRNNFYKGQAFETELTDDSVSGLISLSYALTDDALVYASYARGGKSGGLNLTALPDGVNSTIDPETVDNYELGVKAQWLDARLTTNLAVFNTEVDNYQTIVSEANGNAGVVQYIANAGSVASKGAELDVIFQVNDYLSLNSSVSYTKATYGDYQNAQPKPETENVSKVQDLSGEALPGVPELAWTIGINAVLPIDRLLNGVELYGNANYAYRDGYNTSINSSRYAELDNLGLLTARIGLRTYDGHWDLSLWGKNLTNEDYLHTRGASNTGLISGVVAEPRIVGATLRANF